MEIKLASAADEAEVCRLWTMLLKFYQKQAAPEVLQRSFRYTVEHPTRVLVYIILVEGVVTGTASLHLGHYSTWNDNWYGHVEDVIVDPAYRGRGHATQLLGHLISTAREQNLSRLELFTHSNNHAGRKMYEKIGFTTDSVYYELPLN